MREASCVACQEGLGTVPSMTAVGRPSWVYEPCGTRSPAPEELGWYSSASTNRVGPVKGATAVQGGRKKAKHVLLADWEGTPAAQ